MPEEEIDKIIREAAEQHHPPYNDKDWGKMEALLNKHLPQKKDNRKFLFLMFLFLLIGGAVFFGITQLQKRPALVAKNTFAKQPTARENTFTDKINTASGNSSFAQQKTNTTLTTIVANGNNKISDNEPTTIVNNKNYTLNQRGRFVIKIKSPTATSSDDENFEKEKNNNKQNNDDKGTTIAAEKSTTSSDIINSSIGAPAEIRKNVIINEDSITTIKVETKKDTITASKPTAKQAKKPKRSFSDNFGISFSSGADVSYINISNAGKLKSFYGLGINYNLGKRFAISTGFYVSAKIYSAAPNEYTFSGTPYPFLEKINANCKVYEIPLGLYYNFKTIKKHQWFSSVGLSSYIMKKETYDYLYKNPAGITWNYINTINNQNKNYFSVLTLSGGYQYKLNSRFLLRAEPYVKLPLSGIGAGKVKLGSTGILITVVVKPFVKKKK